MSSGIMNVVRGLGFVIGGMTDFSLHCFLRSNYTAGERLMVSKSETDHTQLLRKKGLSMSGKGELR